MMVKARGVVAMAAVFVLAVNAQSDGNTTDEIDDVDEVDDCQPTCEDLFYEDLCEGTICASNRWLDVETEKCFSTKKCKRTLDLTCPGDQEWLACAECQFTCKDNLSPSSCIPSEGCGITHGAGCGCADGKVFHNASGECLDPEDPYECLTALGSECPTNLLWIDCPTCQGTCMAPSGPKGCEGDTCPEDFDVGGCGCLPGKLYHEETDRCYDPSRCQKLLNKKCPNNQIWTNCLGCQATCTDDASSCSPRESCPSDGSAGGCICPEDLVLFEDKCIKPSKCQKELSKSCESNQVWKDCAACPDTCADPNGEPNCIIPRGCGINGIGAGCGCEEGLLLDPDSGKCLKESKCQKVLDATCPTNQVWLPCTQCRATCQDPNLPMTCEPFIGCGETHGAGCGCPDGEFLDIVSKRCLTEERCQAELDNSCENNQVWLACNECVGTCDEPDLMENCTAPQGCGTFFGAGCGCPEDKVLDEISQACLDVDDCPLTETEEEPPVDCPIGAEKFFDDCRSSCKLTCTNYDAVEPEACDSVCVEEGCECPKGTVLSEAENTCVAPEDC